MKKNGMVQLGLKLRFKYGKKILVEVMDVTQVPYVLVEEGPVASVQTEFGMELLGQKQMIYLQLEDYMAQGLEQH